MSEPNDLKRWLEIRETPEATSAAPTEISAKNSKSPPLFGWHGDAPRGRPRWRVFWWTILATTAACSIPAFFAVAFFWMFTVGLAFMISPLFKLAPGVRGDVDSLVSFYMAILLWLVYYVLVRWFFSAKTRKSVTIAYLVLCLLLILNVVGCQACFSGLSRMGR